MPASAEMRTVDERMVDAPLARIFRLAADVERWPALLPHYRYVRFVDRRSDGGGIVDMSANRPFGVVQWPTWWQSRMAVHAPGGSRPPSIRYTHIAGVTRGMEVEWTFEEMGAMTRVRIVHGRGRGIQRGIVQATLERHPLVRMFWDDPGSQLGATIAELHLPK